MCVSPCLDYFRNNSHYTFSLVQHSLINIEVTMRLSRIRKKISILVLPFDATRFGCYDSDMNNNIKMIVMLPFGPSFV